LSPTFDFPASENLRVSSFSGEKEVNKDSPELKKFKRQKNLTENVSLGKQKQKLRQIRLKALVIAARNMHIYPSGPPILNF
jgi:hypothetical protein